MRFDGSASTAGLGAVITSYVWDFGDNTSGTGMTTTHQYSAVGNVSRETDRDGQQGAHESERGANGDGYVADAAAPTHSLCFRRPSRNQDSQCSSTARSLRRALVTESSVTAGAGATASREQWFDGVAHIYTAGTYVVVLTVTDEVGQVGRISVGGCRRGCRASRPDPSRIPFADGTVARGGQSPHRRTSTPGPKDPASIAFAQLAEEYRRAGSYEDAIDACQSGLAIHPGYLSARVTLGRALLEMNDLDAALGELEYVLRIAPENLAAIRGIAEIHHRRGNLGEALGFYKAALALARHDPDLEQTVDEISRALTPERPLVDDGLSFEQASAEFMAALENLPGGLDAALAPESTFAPDDPIASVDKSTFAPDSPSLRWTSPSHPPRDPSHLRAFGQPAPIAPVAPPALPKLQSFLDAIHTHRQKKAV